VSVEVLQTERGAVYLCTTTGLVFGPVFSCVAEAEALLATVGDPRRYEPAELAELLAEARAENG